MKRVDFRFLSLVLVLSGGLLASCGEDGPLGGGDGGLPGVPGVPGGGSGITDNPITQALAEQCGIDVNCEGAGIAEGNASISGVASIDSFFQSVVNFQAKAGNISAGIDAELDAIRADFGIAAGTSLEAGIQASITANVEGELRVEAEPARCQADVKATLDAQASCEAEVDPGSVMVECSGSCEVEASADVSCDADADLECTMTAPSVECTGTCKGSCEAMIMGSASCEGTCKGTCSGTCSAYADSAQGAGSECAGKCDGMCTGRCEAEFAAGAMCSGTCKGECTVTNPSGGCTGGIRASCKAKVGAMVMCEGRCEGEVTPPMVSAECEASVKAEASMNVECTPPRLAIDYELRAGAGVEAQARFVAAVENLKVRLPSLLAAIKKASLVAEAGAELSAGATGAIQAGGSAAAGAIADGNLRVAFGVACAVEAAAGIPNIITDAAGKLSASLSAAADVKTAVGL